MSTVMTSQDGKRRCDETCHRAHGKKCGCICGGKFHGAHVTPAMEAARTELEELSKKAVRKTTPVLLDSPDQPRLMFDDRVIMQGEGIDEIHERAMFHLRVEAARRKMIGA